MSNIIEAVKSRPEIIKFRSDLNNAIECISRDLWDMIVRQLQSRLLETHHIELGNRQTDFPGWDKCELRVVKPNHQLLIDGTSVDIHLEWNQGERTLRIGVVKKGGDPGFCNMHRAALTKIAERLQMKFGSSFEGISDSTWWPAGVLFLENDFMTDNFIANHTGKDLSDFVDGVATQIGKFIEVFSQPAHAA